MEKNQLAVTANILLISYNCKIFTKRIAKWVGCCYSGSNSLSLRWLLKTQSEFKQYQYVSLHDASVFLRTALSHGCIISGSKKNLWWCFVNYWELFWHTFQIWGCYMFILFLHKLYFFLFNFSNWVQAAGVI